MGTRAHGYKGTWVQGHMGTKAHEAGDTSRVMQVTYYMQVT